jgi:hypothetical protein
MEESEPNGSRVTKEMDKESTQPEEIYVSVDGPEEVAVGQNGKKFKV